MPRNICCADCCAATIGVKCQANGNDANEGLFIAHEASDAAGMQIAWPLEYCQHQKVCKWHKKAVQFGCWG